MLQDCEHALRDRRKLISLSSFDLAFLTIINKIDWTTKHDFVHHATKAAKRHLPPFWAEAQMMAVVLRNAWSTISKKPFEEIKASMDRETGKVDLKRINKALADIANASKGLLKQLPKLESLVKKVQSKSKKNFLDAARLITKEIKKQQVSRQDYETWLRVASMDHMEAALEMYNDRLIHPEIVTRVQQMMERPDIHRKQDMFEIDQKLNRLAEDSAYWENVSSIAASGIWHAESIYIARENGVEQYQIINPLDDRSCPVCIHMHGRIFTIESASQWVDDWAQESDPDIIKQNFPFPRIGDVNRASTEALEAGGFHVPPFHGNCRDEIHLIFRSSGGRPRTDKNTPLDQRAIEQIAPGIKRVGGVIDFDLPQDFKSMEEAKTWLRNNLTKDLMVQDWFKDPGFDLNKMNSALSELRLLMKHMPLKEKLDWMQFGECNTPSDFGEFASVTRREIYQNGAVWISRRVKASIDRQEPLMARQENAYKRLEVAYNNARRKLLLLTKGKPVLPKNPTDLQIKQNKKDVANWQKTIDMREKHLEGVRKDLSSLKHRAEGLLGWEYAADTHNSTAAGTMIHEYGHAWHFQHQDEVEKAFGLKWEDRHPKNIEDLRKDYALTEYASKDWYEMFAENFSAYSVGAIKDMHKDFVKFFDKQFPTLAYGKKLMPEIYGKKVQPDTPMKVPKTISRITNAKEEKVALKVWRPPKEGDEIAPGFVWKEGILQIDTEKGRFKNLKEAKQWLHSNLVRGRVELRKTTPEWQIDALMYLKAVVENTDKKVSILGLMLNEDMNPHGRYNALDYIYLNRNNPVRKTTMAEIREKKINDTKLVIEDTYALIRTQHKIIASRWASESDKQNSRIIIKQQRELITELEKQLDFYVKHPAKTRGNLDDVYSVSRLGLSKGGVTLLHELGHAWHYDNKKYVSNELGIDFHWNGPADTPKNVKEEEIFDKFKTSKYTKETRYLGEVFAEGFSLYMLGRLQDLHPEMVKFFDNTFPKLNFGQKLDPEKYGYPPGYTKPDREPIAQAIPSKERGTKREEMALEWLKEKYPEEKGYKILRERYFCDKTGKKVIDPETGTGRRIDFAVVKGKNVKHLYEVTSLYAPKDAQMEKQNKVRKLGGNTLISTEGDDFKCLARIRNQFIRVGEISGKISTRSTPFKRKLKIESVPVSRDKEVERVNLRQAIKEAKTRMRTSSPEIQEELQSYIDEWSYRLKQLRH